MPVFSPATGNPAARLIQRPSVPSLAPPMVLPSVQAAAQRAPATKIERTYWTKRRVQDGLRRFWIDKQQTPTSSEAYHELTQPHGATGRAPGRYPSFYAVLRWFPSFRAAWESIGLQQDRWWEHWSELDDWYLREGAGILTRKELAADLRRSPDAVHRRLYDLGIHTWERWGWSAYRIQRAAGISESVLRRYMRRGELPYLRGSRVVYVDRGQRRGVRAAYPAQSGGQSRVLDRGNRDPRGCRRDPGRTLAGILARARPRGLVAQLDHELIRAIEEPGWRTVRPGSFVS
jgi:hypothetical protein